MPHAQAFWRSTLTALFISLPAAAQGLVEKDPEAAPLRRLLDELGPDVRQFSEHVVTLANPFMEGRVPGSNGMKVARDYFEFYLKAAGVEPPFQNADGEASYRQAFPLRGRPKIVEKTLAVAGEDFEAGTDFAVLGLSASGSAEAPVAFCGYAVGKGPEGYTSFAEENSLDGKIALIFRNEPMDADGKSRWASGRRPWSRHGSLRMKLTNAIRQGAAGVIFINPPGSSDPRADALMREGSGGRMRNSEIPVVHLSTAAATKLVAKLGNGDATLASLRASADEAGGVTHFETKLSMTVRTERNNIPAENVGGMIAGRGALKDEWVVIGAHLDHLGVGLYGARDRKRIGQLHPGADDNASGSAAVLMLAKSLREAYDELPDGASARSILLVGFDAEEAGLHGSRYYVENPIAPIEKHALMINFDMIGRIVNKRLSVTGVNSAKGLSEMLDPVFEKSPIDVITGGRSPGGSDHLPFMGKEVPWLFAIIKDFHNDYHTPDDVTAKINHVDAVHTIHLFHDVAYTAATHSGPFEFQSNRRGR
ncbi:MAG: M28 family peptidase [bacterium]|nr:M28 family peptidase [bacterium]